MKRIVSIVLAIAMVMLFANVSMAAWYKCKGCHKEAGRAMEIGGKPVPRVAELLNKFKTAADFKKAAKNLKNHPAMTDEDLDTAASDLGLR
jgi:hypothetical protein